jgi:hypothetical protein
MLMSRFLILAGLAPFWLALLLAAPAASAAEPKLSPIGTMEASAHRPLPAGAAIRVRPAGTGATNERIARLFAAELAERGFRLVSGGRSFELSYRFVAELEATPDQPPPHIRLRRPETGDATQQPSGPLPPPADDGRDDVTRVQSSPRTLEVELLDPERDLVWSARASAMVEAKDLEEMARLLVPAVLDRLGQSTAGENVFAR